MDTLKATQVLDKYTKKHKLLRGNWFDVRYYEPNIRPSEVVI
jgi:hypothetical protein